MHCLSGHGQLHASSCLMPHALPVPARGVPLLARVVARLLLHVLLPALACSSCIAWCSCPAAARLSWQLCPGAPRSAWRVITLPVPACGALRSAWRHLLPVPACAGRSMPGLGMPASTCPRRLASSSCPAHSSPTNSDGLPSMRCMHGISVAFCRNVRGRVVTMPDIAKTTRKKRHAQLHARLMVMSTRPRPKNSDMRKSKRAKGMTPCRYFLGG